jgi:putative MATE family efflux protein
LGGAGVAISALYVVGKLYNDPLLKTSVSLVAAADASPSSSEADRSTAVSTALYLASAVGLLQLLFYTLLAPQILTWMSVPPTSPMRNPALSYLRIRSMGSPVATLWLVANGVFRGLGDTKTPLTYALFFTGLNALLDPLFIFTFKMNAGGAALATILSQTLALIPLLAVLHKRVRLRNLLRTKELRADLVASLRTYLTAGTSILVRTVAKVGAYAYTASQAALLGPIAAAAYNLTFQLGFATTQICESVAVAVQTLLAREFAARTDKSRDNGRRLIGFSCLVGGGIASALSALTWFGREQILSFLTTDVGVREAALSIFPVVLVAQVLKGLAYPTNGIVLGGMDWHFSTVTMWASNLVCLTYLKGRLAAKGVGGLLSLGEIWWGLSMFMGTQVGLSVLRVASMTGPWRMLNKKKSQ